MGDSLPTRKRWNGDCPKDNSNCLPPREAWTGGPQNRWSQMRKMRKGDFFSLHIGKPRDISRVEAKSEGIRYPLKCNVEIQEDYDSPWVVVCECNGPIDVSFNPPRKLLAIKFTITEPRLKAPDGGIVGWCIYDLLLTGKGIFGKFKRVIPEE